MMLPCAFIPTVPCVSAVLGPPFARKGRSLIPEFTDERCELGHKVASRLETQACRRPHQEADITTIGHEVSFGSKAEVEKRPALIRSNLRSRHAPRATLAHVYEIKRQQQRQPIQALPCVSSKTFFWWATASFAPGVWLSRSRLSSSSPVTRAIASSAYSRRLGSELIRTAARLRRVSVESVNQVLRMRSAASLILKKSGFSRGSPGRRSSGWRSRNMPLCSGWTPSNRCMVEN